MPALLYHFTPISPQNESSPSPLQANQTGAEPARAQHGHLTPYPPDTTANLNRLLRIAGYRPGIKLGSSQAVPLYLLRSVLPPCLVSASPIRSSILVARRLVRPRRETGATQEVAIREAAIRAESFIRYVGMSGNRQ